MTDKQPEALILADELINTPFAITRHQAAAELRRLQEEVETLRARLSAPEPEPVGWIYEDDEGRMMFSQMPQNPPLWEPVYRAKPREKNT